MQLTRTLRSHRFHWSHQCSVGVGGAGAGGTGGGAGARMAGLARPRWLILVLWSHLANAAAAWARTSENGMLCSGAAGRQA